MIESLARFVLDSYYLVRAPQAASRKFSLWLNLFYPSKNTLGFQISFFRRSTMAYLYREIFARQNYLFRAATESPVIFDCGANLGMATLYFKWLYPQARIEAFEPDPNTFKVLQNNVARNRLADVVTHNCALWSEDGSVDFFVNPSDPGALTMSTNSSRRVGECIQVPSRRLSEFVRGPIDFLKLDVEGAEHHVLCDLVTSGKIKFIQEMVIEYHHHIGNERSRLAGFLQLLEDAGFEYQIHSSLFPVNSKLGFQDLLLRACR
jgi:FkbM family methyltransferase